MQINWTKAYKGLKTSIDFQNWNALRKYFGSDDITSLDVLTYHIVNNVPRFPLRYQDINRAIREAGLKITPQYNSFLLSGTRLSLEEYIRAIKDACGTHSEYTYIVLSFFMTRAEIDVLKVGDFPFKFQHLPEWAYIVVARQYRLAQNSFLLDDDLLLFREEKKKVIYIDHIAPVLKTIEINTGIGVQEYIHYYNLYAGMQNNGRLIWGSNPDISVEIAKRRKRSVKHCVSVMSLKDGERSHYDAGFCLAEVEPGIYLVHGINGIYIVPFYLLDMPRIDVKNYAERLGNLGYIPTEEIRQMGFVDLTKKEIKLQCLNF